MAAIGYRYRAFLSYSHRDAAAARWLHKALEGYRVDRDMVGRSTPVGPVPKTLRPIFRDREDFAAGHSLTAQTTSALEGSQFLVVLCSPNAAKSPYVNEEIRYFKALGRADRVIPIIVEGEPAEGEQDCFPPALRFRVGADGQLTDEREEPIAADARPQGDGREAAKRKLVAGLLGVGLDEIEKRAERARRRRNRVLAALAGTFMLLAVLASASATYAWQQLKTNEAFLNATLKTATEIVNTAVAQAERYNMPRSATLELLTRAEALFDDMARLGRATPELRYRKAWMLIAFAHNYEALGQSDKQLERATEAQRLLAGLVAERPDDRTYQRDLGVALSEVGDVLTARGRLAEALQAYRDSLAIKTRITGHGRANADAWRDELVARIKVGDLLVLQGELNEALASFRRALLIAENLVALGSDNAVWARDLAVANERVGDVLMAQGALPEALAAHRKALALRQKLAAAQPDNWDAQRGLLVAHSKLGEALVAMRDYAGALSEFQQALAIAERLASTDLNNARSQYDLATSYERTGFALNGLNRLDEALASFRAALERFERLVQKDPRNALWRRGMASSYQRVGLILQAKQDFAGALAEFERSIQQIRQLVQTDPSHTGWQRDLAVLHQLIANTQTALHRFAPAIRSFRESLAILETLAKADPTNATWRNDVRVVIESLNSAGYQCILGREFSLALQATEFSAGRAPQVLWLWINHAHALMFAGRVDEARALYLRHHGSADVQDGKSWDAVVLADFAELRRAGLTHPLMQEIERAFATAG